MSVKDEPQVLWYGLKDDWLSQITFKFPKKDISAYQNNDKWDIFVDGGSGLVVSDCGPELIKLTCQPALRLLYCHVPKISD